MQSQSIQGLKLKSLREERGLSQEHLAKVSNVSLRTLQRAEASERLSQENIADLAAALNVQPEELCASDGPRLLILRQTRSALEILRNFEFCSHTIFDSDIDVGPANVEAATTLIGVLEQQAPTLFPLGGTHAPQLTPAARLKYIADLNGALVRAAELGVRTFIGGVPLSGPEFFYDLETGTYHEDANAKPRSYATAYVKVSEDARERLSVPRPSGLFNDDPF
jgi:transcriptional regulator with XRE-family HTH domain